MSANLLVIGAQKCGTTSLQHYLDLHPEIAMAPAKELDFFIEEKNWPRGLAWYEEQLPAAPVRGEASPNYTFHPHFAGVPERAAGIVPDAKLVFIARDPLERIVSHYAQRRAQGVEARPIEEALSEPESLQNPYVTRSRYAFQLERWLDAFPAAQLLVLDQEDLRWRREDTLAEVFAFLGVDAGFRHPGMAEEKLRSDERRELTGVGARLEGSAAARAVRRLPASLRAPVTSRLRRALGAEPERPSMPDDLRERIAQTLRADVARFREISGRSFAGWSL